MDYDGVGGTCGLNDKGVAAFEEGTGVFRAIRLPAEMCGDILRIWWADIVVYHVVI